MYNIGEVNLINQLGVVLGWKGVVPMKKQLVDRSLLQDKIGENTYNALKCLIDNCYYAQLVNPLSNYSRSHIGRELGYFNEFCTVRMCTARQSGHTTAMLKIIKEYFNKAIILSPWLRMSDRLNEIFRKLYPSSKEEYNNYLSITKSEIMTQNEHYLFKTWGGNSLDNKLRGIETEAIFVDGTFEMSKSVENIIYYVGGPCMANYPQKFFVFVQ